MTAATFRILRVAAAASALALVVAACSNAAAGGGPGFTFPPAAAPSTSPAMSMSPDASTPGGSAAPATSGPASTAPLLIAIPTTAGVPLRISAQNIQFDTDHLGAPAGRSFTLEFDNNDPGVPHNVEIKDATGASIFRGQIITGPSKVSYQIPALAAGNYMFLCDVHPTMTGTLTVK
jgi:plastocyanin